MTNTKAIKLPARTASETLNPRPADLFPGAVVVSGNTYEARETLKASGFTWDRKLKVWGRKDSMARCEKLADMVRAEILKVTVEVRALAWAGTIRL